MGRKKNLNTEQTLQKIDITGFDEPKNPNAEVIATWNFDFKSQFIEDQNNCPLCGEELLLTHNTDFIYQSVNEEAHCDKCKIKTRQSQHSLQ